MNPWPVASWTTADSPPPVCNLLTPVAGAQAYCTALTKKERRISDASSLTFFREDDAAMCQSPYALCKEIDNAVDEPPAGSNPKRNSRRWRAELEAVYARHDHFPVTISLAEHVRQLSIPKAYFEELIKGVEMDLTASRYASFQDLCSTAIVLRVGRGLICLHIFGPTSPRAQDYARCSLGLAFQLTNILRTSEPTQPKAASISRKKILDKFSCTDQTILQRQESDAIRELFHFETARAHEYYAKAQAAFESCLQVTSRR